jgi:site-specific DNA-methyltransferase (adenine-specific)
MNDIFNDNVSLKTETPAFAKQVLPAVPSSEVYLEDCVTALKRFNDNHRVSKNQIIWGGNYFGEVVLNGVVIWNKGKNGNMKEGEMAKTSFNTFKIYDKTRVDAYINNGEPKIHPTQKPTSLYDFILKEYAKPNDLILDTHLGSGSSRIAAYKNGFDFVGFEIDPIYYEKQEKRFNDWNSQLRMF